MVHESYSFAQGRRIAESIAKALKVPLVEYRVGVKSVRDGAAVDVLLRDTPASGPVVRPNRSRVIEWSDAGARYAARVPAPRFIPWFELLIVSMLGMPVIFAYVQPVSSNAPAIATLIMIVFVTPLLVPLVAIALSRQEISVDAVTLRVSTSLGGIVWRRRVMPLAALEELILESFKGEERRIWSSVYAVSDVQEIELGYGLNQADAAYLKAQVHQAVTRQDLG